MDPRPVIVLGAERTGTSLVTELVHRWGAYAGESTDLPPPDPRNARGRWEFQPLWQLLAAIGKFSDGLSWWDAGFEEMVKGQLQDERLVGAAHALIRRMEAPGRPWVWKDPALCHFLPFWLEVWKRPFFVLTVRNPLDVAKSWESFAGQEGAATAVEANLLRWQWMTIKTLEHTEHHSRMFAPYEELVEDPERQVQRLAAYLDRAVFNRDVSDDVAPYMLQACDPSLRHQRSDELATEHLSEAQFQLYQHLRSLVSKPEIPFRDAYPLPRGWRQLLIRQERK